MMRYYSTVVYNARVAQLQTMNQIWAPPGTGTCPPTLWKCCKVFLCIRSYIRTLSRRIIYALFLQSVVGFWGHRLQTPSGLHSWTPLGDFHPQTLNLPPPPGKNPAGAHGTRLCSLTTLALYNYILLMTTQSPTCTRRRHENTGSKNKLTPRTKKPRENK